MKLWLNPMKRYNNKPYIKRMIKLVNFHTQPQWSKMKNTSFCIAIDLPKSVVISPVCVCLWIIPNGYKYDEADRRSLHSVSGRPVIWSGFFSQLCNNHSWLTCLFRYTTKIGQKEGERLWKYGRQCGKIIIIR